MDGLSLNTIIGDDFFQVNDVYNIYDDFRYLSHFEMEIANCSQIILDLGVTPLSGSQLNYLSSAMFDITCCVILHSSGKWENCFVW